ncbi:MAG: carbon starvation protein A [Eggerthellaceae bacterium]|nr:carbon starvation protein A [Eggerthellaceae bacterium]
MNAMILLLIAAIVLVCGYVFYGKYLANAWGVDPSRPTPAHEMADGVDYVAAPPYVVLGHHFSSIAGAGPINGPIQAAVFGWVPVTLWVVIGGIFFGAMHDFGALFSSIRHKGQTLAVVVRDNMDNTAKTLFTIFAYLTLVLVVAAFASIVANTFGVSAEYNPAEPSVGDDRNMTTASISMFFIGAAVIWGLLLRGRKIPAAANIGLAIVVLVICVAAGMAFHPIALPASTWMWILAVYILIASLAPVWILLQPRDYLSSYLLYGMIILAFIGIIGAGLSGAAANLEIPAFTGFQVGNAAVDAAGNPVMQDADGVKYFMDSAGAYATSEGVAFTGAIEDLKQAVNSAGASGFLFPALFITIACGAISGFHSLVASGTTSKQIDSEAHAQPIGYGGMLIESLLAIISLCAVGFVWTQYKAGGFAAPTAVFASGLSGMIATVFGEGAQGISYQLLILAVSAFCLTSLDTATRLARYMFQELWIPMGETLETVTGWRKTLSNPYVATIITVILGIGLGMSGYSIIWPLFGAANQLLAALALLAVATWLKNMGRKNGMFYFPMIFMLAVTLTSLVQTIMAQFSLVSAGGDVFAPGLRLVIACLLFVLAIVLAVRGAKSLWGSDAKSENQAAA